MDKNENKMKHDRKPWIFSTLAMYRAHIRSALSLKTGSDNLFYQVHALFAY